MSGKKFLSDINMDGNKISNVANPTQSGDVATFDWVNNIIQSQDSVDVSIESRIVNIISNDTQEIDSITEIVQVIQSNEMALDSAITSLELEIQQISGPTGATGPVSPEYLNPVFTVELMDVLSQYFYTPFNLKIDTITNIVNTPITALAVNDSPYVLGESITVGGKITVTLNTQGVINLNTTRL